MDARTHTAFNKSIANLWLLIIMTLYLKTDIFSSFVETSVIFSLKFMWNIVTNYSTKSRTGFTIYSRKIRVKENKSPLLSCLRIQFRWNRKCKYFRLKQWTYVRKAAATNVIMFSRRSCWISFLLHTTVVYWIRARGKQMQLQSLLSEAFPTYNSDYMNSGEVRNHSDRSNVS